MSEFNKQGLTREIPSEIKREIRKRCAFGCTVCGTAIIQYHHFDPEFVDATEHNPIGITLLCPTCHEKVKKRIFDFDFIKESDCYPFCKRLGHTKDILYVGARLSAFKLGSAWFKLLTIVQYDNEPIISFSPPETENAPLRLNAILFDKEEKQMLSIIDNELLVGIEHFDVETKSNELIIREKMGEIKFHLSYIANKEISIHKINMKYKGFTIQVLNSQFIVHLPNGGKMNLTCPNIYSTLKLFSSGGVGI
jgi:hypothetical protein